MNSWPVLYTFRRCPYAIRARMALLYCSIRVELREVLLKDKPSELIELSPKATVPVLSLPGGEVLEHSIDIIRWALSGNDPDNWLSPTATADSRSWIDSNDGEFKHWLDRYKYADRHPEQSANWYRSQASPFLERIEQTLSDNTWLHGQRLGIADVALFPFIRQFAAVDEKWFAQAPFPALTNWLQTLKESELFLAVMEKQPRWEPGKEPIFNVSEQPHPTTGETLRTA